MGREIDFIFDRNGDANYRILPRGIIHDYSGNCIAYIANISIFDYQGTHRAWYEDGVLRDQRGEIVGFTKNFKEKIPGLTFRRNTPIRSIMDKPEPIRQIKKPAPIRPFKKFTWSNKTLKQTLEDKML